MVGGRKQRHVKRDDIALPVEGVNIHIFCHFRYFCVLVYIISQDAAAKALQVTDHLLADTAGSHNAYGHGSHIFSLKSCQGKVVDIAAPECLLILS